MLFVAAAVAGCGGAGKTPAGSESTAPVGAPMSKEESAPPSPPASSAPESAIAGGAASSSPPASSAAEPAAPKSRSAPVEIAVVGKHAGDAAVEHVVVGARTGLQNCYETGLQSAPTAMGVVDFKIMVTASGVLKKVESTNPNTMPGSITNCMVGKFGALSFEPRPATTIEVKVTCRPNG